MHINAYFLNKINTKARVAEGNSDPGEESESEEAAVVKKCRRLFSRGKAAEFRC